MQTFKTCNHCAAPSHVTDSRQHPSYRRRRYECDRGHRWTTIEVIIPETTIASRPAAYGRLLSIIPTLPMRRVQALVDLLKP